MEYSKLSPYYLHKYVPYVLIAARYSDRLESRKRYKDDADGNDRSSFCKGTGAP